MAEIAHLGYVVDEVGGLMGLTGLTGLISDVADMGLRMNALSILTALVNRSSKI